MNPNNQRLLSVRDLQKQLRTLPIQEQKALANACKVAEIESPEVIFGSFMGLGKIGGATLTIRLFRGEDLLVIPLVSENDFYIDYRDLRLSVLPSSFKQIKQLKAIAEKSNGIGDIKEDSQTAIFCDLSTMVEDGLAGSSVSDNFLGQIYIKPFLGGTLYSPEYAPTNKWKKQGDTVSYPLIQNNVVSKIKAIGGNINTYHGTIKGDFTFDNLINFTDTPSKGRYAAVHNQDVGIFNLVQKQE